MPNPTPLKGEGRIAHNSEQVKIDPQLFISGLPGRLEQLAVQLGGQNALGRRAGVSSASMSNYIRGASVPGGDVLAGLVAATGCSSDWLLTGRGPMFATASPNEDDGSRDHVVGAWSATLTLLSAACNAQRELAPLIGSDAVGDAAALGQLADQLRGSMHDLEELSRLAAKRSPPRRAPTPSNQRHAPDSQG